MFSVLLVLLVIVSVMMIGVILLQKSEGSGMSGSSAASMFGGALTGASAGNFLTKLTTWLAVIFFVLCAALAIISSKSQTASQESAAVKGVVRGLDRHLNVVGMGFPEPGGGDADETPALLQLGDAASARVEHRLPQTPDQLIGDGGQRSPIGDLAFDPLGDEPVVAGHVRLEITILRVGGLPPPCGHRAERAHAPIGLVLLAVDEHQFAG